LQFWAYMHVREQGGTDWNSIKDLTVSAAALEAIEMFGGEAETQEAFAKWFKQLSN